MNLSKLFAALACYGIGFGILSLPTGLFVGPHMLAASLGHIAIGALSAWIALGLARQRVWAWWSGVSLSFLLAVLSLTGFGQSLAPLDAVGIIFYSVLTVFLLCVLIASIWSRKAYVR